MKKLLMLLTLFVSIIAAAQVTPEMLSLGESGYIVISNVEQVPGATTQQIHDAITKWIATTYKNPKFVTKADTPTMITIEGDGPYLSDPSVDVRYTVTLVFEIKDGRYKWTIKDAKIERPDLSSFVLHLQYAKGKSHEEQNPEIAQKFSPYVESFQTSIKDSCSDDW